MCAGPFLLQALYGEVCGFSALAPPLAGVSFSSVRSSSLLLSCRFTLSFGPSATPFGCLPLSGLFALLLGPLRCFSSPATFLIIRIAPFDSSPLACQDGSLLCGLSDGHPYWRASGALSLFFSASEVTPVCHLSLPLLPSVSRSLFHPSLLLGCISVRLCGWSGRMSFALPSSCPLLFPGQDGFRAVSPLPSFCLSALPVSGSFFGRGFVPPPGGVPAAGAARLGVSPVRTHEFSGISTSVAFLSDGRLLFLLFMFPLFLCFMSVST